MTVRYLRRQNEQKKKKHTHILLRLFFFSRFNTPLGVYLRITSCTLSHIVFQWLIQPKPIFLSCLLFEVYGHGKQMKNKQNDPFRHIHGYTQRYPKELEGKQKWRREREKRRRRKKNALINAKQCVYFWNWTHTLFLIFVTFISKCMHKTNGKSKVFPHGRPKCLLLFDEQYVCHYCFMFYMLDDWNAVPFSKFQKESSIVFLCTFGQNDYDSVIWSYTFVSYVELTHVWLMLLACWTVLAFIPLHKTFNLFEISVYTSSKLK